MRLAIVSTHPIQYYAPWFRRIADTPEFSLRVFYLWDFGVTEQVDKGFGKKFQWDVPLLDGYESEFVPNDAREPGTHHFRGLWNPRLRWRIEAFKPDAVLVFGYRFASTQRFIWTWPRRQAPLLFRGDSHRLVKSTGWKESVRKHLISLVYRRFSAFLYVGQANREYFRAHDVPEEKLFFAPHAVDNERFGGALPEARAQALTWRAELGIPAEQQVVLFAGKLQPKKRPTDLLEAFLAVNQPSATLLFVGDGELEAELRARAGGRANVVFAPFQNQSQMPRTYAAADLFVLPSLGRDETWGLAVNEAMCVGLPVLVSSHVGCGADLVRHGQNGLLFPAGDIAALTSSLREALADRTRLGRWGEESRRIVASYDYRAAVEGLRQACRALGAFKAG